MITVIANHCVKLALEQTLPILIGDLDTYEGALVHVDGRQEPGQPAHWDEAVRLAQNGIAVLILSFQTETAFATDLRYHVAMGHPKVTFARLPITVIEMAATLNLLQEGNYKPADPLAQQLLSLPLSNNSSLGIAKHDLGHALNDTNGAEQWDHRWMPLAKTIFGDLSRDELIQAVQSASQPDGLKGHLAGQSFPDVCVDTEGTLLDRDGAINTEVLEMVRELAKTNPITVWTGGDVESLQEKLLAHGIIYKMLPKELFAGATVKMVIDDLPQSEFDTTYGVNYLEYQ